MMKNKKLEFIMKIFAIMFSAAIYACFFKIIVEGRGFLAMGASGVSVILSRVIGKGKGEDFISILYMIFYIAINIPLFIFAYKKISKKFVLFTIIYVLTFSLVVGFLPSNLAANIGFDKIDDLTAAILIGLVSGFSCASAMMIGGCAGGLDMVSTYLMIKKGKGTGVYNFIFNSIILAIGLIISTVPAIIYTLVYAFFSSTILDRHYNRNKKILLEIVTTKKDEVCAYLLANSHHGCTYVEAKGAYTNDDKHLIHTVISWFQLKSVVKAIKSIDEHSFIIDLNVYNVSGNFYMPPIK